MIYADSRYATGVAHVANDSRSGQYSTVVRRTFPTKTTNFFTYVWVQGDRIDLIASQFFGDPSYWWKIMDVNPEITNPFSIPIGTTIRIPGSV